MVDKNKFEKEFQGPKKGLKFFSYDDPNIFEQILHVISIHSPKKTEKIMKMLKNSAKKDGFSILHDGIAANNYRLIWTHNDFLCSSVGIPGLEQKATFEIKEMRKVIESKMATILQCDSFNSVEYCEELVRDYNLLGFVTDQVGDIIIGLVNFENNPVNYGDYSSFKSFAEKYKQNGNKLSVIIDENTPSGREFLRKMKSHKIDLKIFDLQSGDGEYSGVRKISKNISEPHVLVSVRPADISLALQENYFLFDQIPHGDLVFLDKRFSKKDVVEAYLLSIKEQSRAFNSYDPEILYRIFSSPSKLDSFLNKE